jgi:hypothetical protein
LLGEEATEAQRTSAERSIAKHIAPGRPAVEHIVLPEVCFANIYSLYHLTGKNNLQSKSLQKEPGIAWEVT